MGRRTHWQVYRQLGPKKDINIQMVYFTKGSLLQTQVGQAKGIQAIRKVEFVVCTDFHLTTGAKYSDLVLPVTHMWERDGYIASPNRETLFWASQVMPPLFEAKDDEWIDWELGKRLGVIKDGDTPELPLKQHLFNQIAGATVMKDDGKTRSPGDHHRPGSRGPGRHRQAADRPHPRQGVPGQGLFQVPRKPGDNFTAISLKSFRQDPVKNPLKTESGKIEIHCRKLAETINALGWSVIRPIPAYIPPEKGTRPPSPTGRRRSRASSRCRCTTSITCAAATASSTTSCNCARPSRRSSL